MPIQETTPLDNASSTGDKGAFLATTVRQLRHRRIATELPARDIALVHGDVFDALDQLVKSPLRGRVDVAIADPPYFVGKADWDGTRSLDEAVAFHEEWLSLCRELLAEHGSLWACGDFRSLPALLYAIERVGLQTLAEIVWEKTNPMPHMRGRCFVRATESVIWCAKHEDAPHRYNFDCLRQRNGGRPMTSHWRMATTPMSQKRHGYHPTQKPLGLIERCIEATTGPGDLVLDPFVGSGTTAVASYRLGRRCIGIDQSRDYLQTACRRVRAEAIATPTGLSNVGWASSENPRCRGE